MSIIIAVEVLAVECRLDTSFLRNGLVFFILISRNRWRFSILVLKYMFFISRYVCMKEIIVLELMHSLYKK